MEAIDTQCMASVFQPYRSFDFVSGAQPSIRFFLDVKAMTLECRH